MEILKSITDFINKNPWLNLIFLILAIFSILTSIIIYIKSKKTRKPTFYLRSINLVRGNIKKIKSVDILYEGNKIDNLTITKLAFWNAGKETINENDIANADKIKIITVNEAKILDAEILYHKNVANNFTINLDKEKNEVQIQFEYIDNNEGVIIQLYHTGISDDDIGIKGTVKGTKSILFKRGFYASGIREIFKKGIIEISPYRIDIIAARLLLTLATITIIIGFLVGNNSGKIAYFVMGLITILITFLMILRPTPKGFDIFEDEF